MTAAPQLQSNTALIRQEQQQQARQDEQRVKNVAISLQGVAQQILPVFLQGVDCFNTLPDDLQWKYDSAVRHSIDVAEKAYIALQERAHKLAQ